VSEGTTGSTVPRRQLGRYLRDLRGKARLTVKAAAVELEWSEAKIWRIETGQTSLRSFDVETMCKVYGAPAELAEALKALAKETKARGWWMSYGDVIPEGFDLYIGLEEAAARLDGYFAELVPGLLQTEDYARMLIQTDNPGVDADEIERRVRLRLERQSLLTRVSSPPQLHYVLNEAILRRPVGGKAVMAQQLRRLQAASNLPNVALRVMAFSTGLHYGIMSGPFIKLEFPLDGSGQPFEPPTIYADGFTGALFLEKPHEIVRYTKAFTSMWDSALNEVDSMRYIAAAAEEMEH